MPYAVFYHKWICEVVQILLFPILLIRETEAQKDYMTCPRSHNLLLSIQNKSPGPLVPGSVFLHYSVVIATPFQIYEWADKKENMLWFPLYGTLENVI